MLELIDGFRIGEHFFAWGSTPNQVRQVLADEPPLEAYGPGFRYRIAQAGGFPAIACSGHAPADDRPVMNLGIELAPFGNPCSPADPLAWLEPLKAHWGTPAHVRSDPSPQAPSSSVIYSASWQREGLELHFSVFGGHRTGQAGVSVAGLYLSWRDTCAAASPYLPELIAAERRLAAIASAGARFEYFALEVPQQAMHRRRPDGREQPGPMLEAALRTLYTPQCVNTPDAWASKLNDCRVGLWVASDGLYWGLSTRQDSVFFEMGAEIRPLDWEQVLPAKGCGGNYLRVGALELADIAASHRIPTLVDAIERRIRRPIPRQQSYDC